VDATAEDSVARPLSDSDAQLRGRQLGDFVLRECIGEGGFAAVYRCDQPLLGREAVVKVLHQRMRTSEVVLQRFMREARLASRLDHPYAAHVYAFGVEADGLAWIAMELVHGTPLDRWLRERGPLPLEVLVPFFEQVAEIVQNAHDHGIVHRDLKPSNVMITEYAERVIPKLLDFGIAKLIDDAAQISMPGVPLEATIDAPTPPAPTDNFNQHLTQANATLGSPPYMSPEQWCDPMSVGPRSDLYSLAIMAYEALTGHQPFTGTTIAAIGEQHCNAEIPKVGDQFPASLDRVFQRALAKHPNDRPATALAFAKELRAATFPRPYESSGGMAPLSVTSLTTTPQNGTAVAAVAVAPVEATQPAVKSKSKRKLWPLATGAAALVAVGIVAYTFLGAGNDRASAQPPAPLALPIAPPPPPAPAAVAPAAPTGPALGATTTPPADTHPTVVVEIESNPLGADVFRLPSEIKVGSTPWRAELPSEAGIQIFLVKKPGFGERVVEIDLRTGGTRSVKLLRGAHRPVVPPARTEPARHKGEPVDPFRTPGAI
jgi:serine/threonine protein kinase